MAMAGVPPRRCRSGLSAVSLGYRSRSELSASGAVRACAMGGASVWECGRVDVNTRHDVSIGLDDPSGGHNLRLDASGAKRPFGEPTITLEAKAWLTSLPCRKAKELGYPHELWTTRLLARHAREHGPAEGHPCLANTKMAVARVAAPDWSCAGSRGGGANPRHRASGCRRHTAGLRHRACASAGH